MTVTIRMLGPFQVLDGSRVVIDDAWPRSKGAALVKMLALQTGHSMHREELIDRLWADHAAESGVGGLYKALHYVRTAMREAGATSELVSIHRGIASLHRDIEVDVDTFRTLAHKGLLNSDPETLEGAIQAFGGDLLPSDIYETWTQAHRDDLRTLNQLVHLRLGGIYLSTKETDSAIGQFRECLAADPLSEEAHRGLMQAYSSAGLRELAIRQYKHCCRTLREELDVDPEPATIELVQQLGLTEPDPQTHLAHAHQAGLPPISPKVSGIAALDVLRPGRSAERFELSPDRSVLLGRSDDNDIVLDSPHASRYHARVSFDGASYQVRDLDSKNGTWVNDERVAADYRLADNDTIRIGDVNIVFKVPAFETLTLSES